MEQRGCRMEERPAARGPHVIKNRSLAGHLAPPPDPIEEAVITTASEKFFRVGS